MSALDFQDREPETDRTRRPSSQDFSGNRAFYERLQGQGGNKSAIERYGWIAVPVAAVAIIGIAAATSVPHKSADDVGGAPPALNTAAVAPAPAAAAPAQNSALASNDAVQTPDRAAPSGPASEPAKSLSVTGKSSASAPAPVKVARKAAPSDAVTTRPASVATARTAPATAAAPDTAASTPAPAVQAPAPAVTQDAAPQPAAPAPSSDAAPASPSAPADSPPAQ